MSLRSTQEGKPSFEKVEAAPESLPGKKTEAQSSESSCTKASFTVSTLLENFPKRQTWEKKGTAACAEMAWVSEAQALEARAGEAQAWEAQACKIQGRFNQLRQTSSLEVETARILKQEPVPEKVPEKEKSEDFFIRPLWSNKVEYIMAQVGYSVRTLHIWRFIYMWLHHGGCKSGDQKSWIHKGLARQRPTQASNFKISGICSFWRLGTLCRTGARCLNT